VSLLESEYTLVVHGKGAKVRDVPLNASLARELLALDPGWAFPGDMNGHISPAWAGKIVTRLLPDGYTMHKLRHKCASDAFDVTGGNIYVVKELLGHSNINTTLAYVAKPDDAVRTAVTAISERRWDAAA